MNSNFSYTHDGKEYTSITSLVNGLGFSACTFWKYLKKGNSIPECIKICKDIKSSRGVDFQGKHYTSLKNLAKEYSIGYETLLARTGIQGMTLEEAVLSPVRKINSAKDIVFRDITYPTITSLARAFNIGDWCLRDRLSKGMSLEEAISTPVEDLGKCKPISFIGYDYRSIADLARAYGLKPRTLSQRLCDGMDLETAVLPVGSLYKGTSKSIDFEGTTYESLKKLAKAFSIEYYNLLSRLNMGWKIEIALTKPVYRIDIEYKDKSYTDYKSLADDYNIDVDVVRTRLKAGWSVEEAVTKPVREYKTHVCC